MTAPQPLTIEVALQQAIAHHQTGQLQEAEQLYRAILQAMPAQADANHNLGLIACQCGRPAMGLTNLKTAFFAQPAHPQYSLTYVEALLATGNAQEAYLILRHAMQHGQSSPSAQALLQRITAALLGGQIPELKRKTATHAELNHLIALYQSGQYPMVEIVANEILMHDPQCALVWKILGAALQMQSKESCLQAMETAARLLPNDAEAHANFGIALRNFGHLQKSAESCQLAVKLNPNSAHAQNGFGLTLRDLGRLEDAISSYRRAIKLQPDYVEVYCNLGDALSDSGKNDEALINYRKAVDKQPNYTGAHVRMGDALRILGRLDEASSSYRHALDLDPVSASACRGLANTLAALGKHDDAIGIFEQVLKVKADQAETHCDLGDLLTQLQRTHQAQESYRNAVIQSPSHAIAYNNLGNLLHTAGKSQEAVTSYRCAITIKADFAIAHNNLGNALREIGNLDAAIVSFQKSLEFDGNSTQTLNNLGNALWESERYDEAISTYQRALQFDINSASLHTHLANALTDNNQNEEAIGHFRRALVIDPSYLVAHNNIGKSFHALGQFDSARISYQRALMIDPESDSASANFVAAFTNLLFLLSQNHTIDAKALFAKHCEFGERFESPFIGKWPAHRNTRDPGRPLHIGFVSGDLRHHAVATFIEPIFAQLANRDMIVPHVYSNHATEDTTTGRLRALIPRWHNVLRMDDDALAEQIQADGIDILIDLSGHTAYHRLLIFARKPAPIQASWIGYPGTTGLQAMDYYLADRHFLPVGQFEGQFVEKIVHLPVNASFLPYADAPEVNALPALRNGYMTFGSFNRISKITPPVITMWAQLLHAVPTARLLLGGVPGRDQCKDLLDGFVREGIPLDRIDAHPRSDMKAYLALHHQVDLCLDTMPYTGGTTTWHALWMGVPTLTMAGDKACGRQGTAILGRVGLDMFSAQNIQEFVQKGIDWTTRLEELSTIRMQLRDRFAQSDAGKPAVIADGLEQALRAMWQRWCAGLPPTHIER